MTEIRDADASNTWFSAIAMLTVGAAMVAIAYAASGLSPVAAREPSARWSSSRVVRLRTDYPERSANVTEVVQVINEVLDEIARANSTRSGS